MPLPSELPLKCPVRRASGDDAHEWVAFPDTRVERQLFCRWCLILMQGNEEMQHFTERVSEHAQSTAPPSGVAPSASVVADGAPRAAD